MGIAFKIAWRNLWRHRGKCLVIGLILFLGALLMTVGNGIISGMEEGLSENIVNLFTGDIVVISDEQEKDNVLFDMMSGKPLKVIKNYDRAAKVLAEEEIIEDYLPATAGLVFVFTPGSEMGNIMLLGVNIERYRDFFPESIKITKGRMLEPGERGLLVSEVAREQGYNMMDFWAVPEGEELDVEKLPVEARENIDNLEVKRNIVFMGASTSNATVDISVPVKGIMKYKSLNKVWGMYCIIDIESFREAHNYVTGSDSMVELSAEEKELLETEEMDNYFGSDEMFSEAEVTEENLSMETIKKETGRNKEGFDVDKGSYNLAFLKLKDGVSQKKALKELNELFEENELNIRAVSWKSAVGTIGSMAGMVKGGLNLFIMFIFFVAIIVIMNTLSMTALERISEFAMMRAIGARKVFLRKMFVFETGILAFFFGGLGIGAGIIVIYLLRMADITTTNEILQMVYGGDKLNPLFTTTDFMIGLAELGIVTLLSVIYPLRVVGKIVPLDAIVRE